MVTNGEIGAALSIAIKTVEAHKTHLMAKLGLKTRAQLVRYAIYRGWLSDDRWRSGITLIAPLALLLLDSRLARRDDLPAG